MKWLKDVIIDIAVTAVVLIYTFSQPAWAEWVIMIYTPLLLLLKGMAVANPLIASMASKKGSEVPFWFHHALYAVSVLSLLIIHWYLMAGLWVAIWIMSIAADGQARSSSSRTSVSVKGGKLRAAKG